MELKCMSAGVVNPLSAVLDNFGDNKVRFWSTTCTTTTSTTSTDIGGMGGQLLALRARWSGDSAICPPALIICPHIALSFSQFYERNLALIIICGWIIWLHTHCFFGSSAILSMTFCNDEVWRRKLRWGLLGGWESSNCPLSRHQVCSLWPLHFSQDAAFSLFGLFLVSFPEKVQNQRIALSFAWLPQYEQEPESQHF